MPVISNDIVIAGVRYALGGDIRVINFLDNPDYSFQNPTSTLCESIVPGTRTHGFRDDLDEAELLAVGPENIIDWLARTVHQVVIHHDASPSAHATFSILCRRGLSSHFLINHDGGLIQGLDVIFSGWHAGHSGVNRASVGVDMNNIAVVDGNQRQMPSDPAFGPGADYTSRPTIEGRINGSFKKRSPFSSPAVLWNIATCSVPSSLNTCPNGTWLLITV